MDLELIVEDFIQKCWLKLHLEVDSYSESDFAVAKETIKKSAEINGVELQDIRKFQIDFSKSVMDVNLGILYQIASKADIRDHHNDIIPLVELKKAAFNFVKNSRKGDQNHDFAHTLDLVESLVFDETIIKAVKEGKIQAGDWVIGWEPQTEELKKKAINGEIKGASIAGTAIRRPVK